MIDQKLELLAPAGSFEALKAAVLNGADAVYLGGGKFNARVNAGNFTEEELIKAFDYAHERGVRVYLTLNTLLKNEELEEALRFAAFAYQQGADAVIVQDSGLLSLIRKFLPDFAIHASTQMTATSSATVQALEGLGVRRVVLARELTLEQIHSIANQTKTELEVFVHGALCVCYSGQCLMSSFIGGRSGNRGVCAQPCRLPWSLSHEGLSFGKEAYLLSPRDLMAIDLLPQLKDAGVTSLKLEGRMKSPEYVAIITSIYRKYLDLLNKTRQYRVEEADRERLLQAFNRGGFTQSYMKGDRDFRKLVYTSHPKNQGLFIGTVSDIKPLYARVELERPLHRGDGIEIMDDEKGPHSLIVTAIMQNGEHVKSAPKGASVWVGDVKAPVKKGSQVFKTLSKPLFEEARQTYEHREGAFIPLDMHFVLKTGEKAQLTIKDIEGFSVTVNSDDGVEKALNKPLSIDRIQEQLKKTGDTPYWLQHLNVDTDGESTLPISVVNALRRQALEELRDLRIKSFKRTMPDLSLGGRALNHLSSGQKALLSLSAYFHNVPATLKDFSGLVSRVYLPVISRERLVPLRESYAGELYLWTPAILKDDELARVAGTLYEVSDLWEGIACGSLGALEALKKAFPQKAFCAEYTMNLFNHEALVLQRSLGTQTAVLSPELRLSEVEKFSADGLALEALVYGRLPMMTMEHCPPAAEAGCSGLCEGCARKKGFLKDRKGELFPFARDPILKRTQVFNAFPLFMDDVAALKQSPLDLLRLTFTSEDQETCAAVAQHYAALLKGHHEVDTNNRRIIQDIKDQGFTKGHWFRGV